MNIALILNLDQDKISDSDRRKNFTLQNKPLIYFTVQAYAHSKIISDIYIAGKESEKDIINSNLKNVTKFKEFIPIKVEQQDTIKFCLYYLENKIQYIFIHDAIRPFVTTKQIEKAYEAVTQHTACVFGHRPDEIIKIIDKDCRIISHPDQSLCVALQSPVVFEFERLKKAYAVADSQNIIFSDEISLYELICNPVKIIPGAENLKNITSKADLIWAENFLQEHKNFYEKDFIENTFSFPSTPDN